MIFLSNFFRPGQDARSEAEHSVLLPGTQTKRTERSGVSALGFSLRVILGYVAAGILILFLSVPAAGTL